MKIEPKTLSALLDIYDVLTEFLSSVDKKRDKALRVSAEDLNEKTNQ